MTDRRADRPFKALAGAALAFGFLVAPGAARAQMFGGWGGWDNAGTWDGLGPQQVRRAVSQRGFRVLAPLRRNGNVFVADVLDGSGRHERLVIAAADAQILQRFMVDDGRQPGAFARGTDDGRDFTARGSDDDRGLVPPGDIPGAGRRFARPTDRDAAPPQRFGDLAPDEGAAPAALESPLRRTPPPIRTVKPRPRVAERTPEAPLAVREPAPVVSTPLAPAAPRPAASTVVPIVKAPVAPPAVVASRPEPAAAPAPAIVPAAPAVPATASRRMTDPLAIPGGGDGKPVRSVAAGITGAPASAAVPIPAPAKPSDVPVAPLD